MTFARQLAFSNPRALEAYACSAARVSKRLGSPYRSGRCEDALFYESASDGSALTILEQGTRFQALIDDFVSSPEGLKLVQSFMRIESAMVRRRIVALVQEVASHDRFEDG